MFPGMFKFSSPVFDVQTSLLTFPRSFILDYLCGVLLFLDSYFSTQSQMDFLDKIRVLQYGLSVFFRIQHEDELTSLKVQTKYNGKCISRTPTVIDYIVTFDNQIRKVKLNFTPVDVTLSTPTTKSQRFSCFIYISELSTQYNVNSLNISLRQYSDNLSNDFTLVKSVEVLLHIRANDLTKLRLDLILVYRLSY